MKVTESKVAGGQGLTNRGPGLGPTWPHSALRSSEESAPISRTFFGFGWPRSKSPIGNNNSQSYTSIMYTFLITVLFVGTCDGEITLLSNYTV